MKTPDELRTLIGQPPFVTDWIMIDQTRINQFADCTDDHQFVHVDPERAQHTVFGGTVAHGFLTLSLLASMMYQSPFTNTGTGRTGVNYGLNRVRFLSPVHAGKRVRGHLALSELEDKGHGRVQLLLACSVEVEGQDKPAMIADWIIQFIDGDEG